MTRSAADLECVAVRVERLFIVYLNSEFSIYSQFQVAESCEQKKRQGTRHATRRDGPHQQALSMVNFIVDVIGTRLMSPTTTST
jgi:hypothetical protein